MQAKTAYVLAHIRDILLLPFSVLVLVPLLIYNPKQHLIPNNLFLTACGVFFFCCGLILLYMTVKLFFTLGKGTLAPWHPTRNLIAKGPYRYCRNPMISGVLFMLVGETFFFHSTSIMLWAICFFVLNTVFFIIYEEPTLLKRFGKDYLRYKNSVPRWIPKMKPYTHSPSVIREDPHP